MYSDSYFFACNAFELIFLCIRMVTNGVFTVPPDASCPGRLGRYPMATYVLVAVFPHR